MTLLGDIDFRRQLLIWDTYNCHLTDNVRNVVSNATNSDIGVIPGGLTGHLQQNKPIKAAYKELYGEWTATGQKTYTRAGNIHAPSKL